MRTHTALLAGSRLFLGLFAASVLLLSAPDKASAQSINTLERIRQTKVLLVGVRDKTLPFSTLSSDGAKGYSVELCTRVLEQVRKELKNPDIKAQYVVVTAGNRINKLKDGSIDIECGQTVNTKARSSDVSFSYTFFVAGQRIMTRQDSGVRDLSGLAGKVIGVVKGSTSEIIFTQLQKYQMKTMTLKSFETIAEAFSALDDGKIAAMAQPDIALENLRAQSGRPDRYIITPDKFSVEPMALMVRKGDDAFKNLVDKTMAGLFSSGEINTLYNKWFMTSTLKVPMSMMLKDCLTRPSREPGVALGVGYSL